MARRKILVLAPYLTVEHAGAAQSTITILQALSRSDWADVTLGAYIWDDNLVPSNVRRVRLNEGSFPAPLWRLFPLPDYWTATRAIRHARLGEFDLCYTQSVALGLAFRRLHPHVRVVSHPGWVLWSREVMAESEAPLRWRRLSARIARWLEARSYRQRDWLHFVPSRLVAEIRAESFGLDAASLTVAPLPVSPARFDVTSVTRDVRAELGLNPTEFVLITVARLVSLKRIDAIIRAVAATRRRVVLLVLGEGPERKRLEGLARELGVAERIRFLGRQDPPAYLAAANLFALPSSVESFGLAFVEAMMMGLPCIGLRYRPPEVLSAASEIIAEGETGFCVSSDDELQSIIETLASDPARCRALGERARFFALEHFTPEEYVARLRRALPHGAERIGVERDPALSESSR